MLGTPFKFGSCLRFDQSAETTSKRWPSAPTEQLADASIQRRGQSPHQGIPSAPRGPLRNRAMPHSRVLPHKSLPPAAAWLSPARRRSPANFNAPCATVQNPKCPQGFSASADQEELKAGVPFALLPFGSTFSERLRAELPAALQPAGTSALVHVSRATGHASATFAHWGALLFPGADRCSSSQPQAIQRPAIDCTLNDNSSAPVITAPMSSRAARAVCFRLLID